VGGTFISVFAGHPGDGVLLFVFPDTTRVARVVCLAHYRFPGDALHGARISDCPGALIIECVVVDNPFKLSSHRSACCYKSVGGGITNLCDCCAHPTLGVRFLVDDN
jgi:hypothetical protein